MNGVWLFAWRGLSPAGDLISAHIIGTDHLSVRRQLIGQHFQPFSVRMVGYVGRGYWRKSQLAALMAQLGLLLGAGLPLREGLRLLAEDHPRAGWRCLLQLLGDKIEQGLTLSEALEDVPHIFPPVYCAMMSLGEHTGRLDRCCQALAEHESRLQQLRQQVLAALRYPAFIGLTAAAVFGLMLTWVLPEFAQLYAALQAPLPPSTRCLLRLAEHAAGYGLAALIVPLSLYGVCRRIGGGHPQWRRYSQGWLLYLPAVGPLIRHHNLHQLFQTLAMTHPAGIPLDGGLELAARSVSHPGYRRAVSGMREHIQQGFHLHQAVCRHPLFPPHCHQLIKTGEFSGTLDEVFRQLACLHGQHTQRLSVALAQLAEPLILVVVGGAVCALLIMLYLPLLQLGEAFGQF